jgi:hypothetical protein
MLPYKDLYAAPRFRGTSQGLITCKKQYMFQLAQKTPKSFDQFADVPMYALEGLGTDLSGPKVSTYEIEAIMATEMATESPIEPTFLNSEPTHVWRKRKAKDMSGLTLCLCGECAEPGDVGSIQCRKAECATVWVCYSATFDKFMADTAHSIIFNVLGMRTHN